ncbi:MAG TPA: hypothetical protein VES00_00200 [Burkholderiaceae bacterium]|nr:hypothetical protein [Burkholderiaceae bacterium]
MNPTTTSRLRRRGLLAAGALAALLNLGCAPAAWADARLVQVEVVDRDEGVPLRFWRDHGRLVVAGRPGARYSVRLVNATGQRVLAVVAIDGVNVVSGETAGVNQRGYVLEPWQRTEITGWRKNDSEVAAFEFTALSDSYAARTGRPRDVGVIGVAVFREAARVEVSESRPLASTPPPLPAPRAENMAKAATGVAAAEPDGARDAAVDAARRAPAPPEARAMASPPAERLGTGHGARETSVVSVTTFERATSQPEQRVEIRYDSYENLVAAGIVPPPPLAAVPPHAFPADPPRGYVPDPPRR